MVFQEWKGQEQVLDEGMAVGRMTKSRGADGEETELDVSVTADGEMIATTEEHYLCHRIDRLNDEIRLNLRELECLLDLESASGGESVAQVLSVANDSESSDTSES